MKYLQRIFTLMVLILIVGILFQNQKSLSLSVDLKFFTVSTELIFGFWLLISFVLGALSSMVFDVWRALGMKIGLRRRQGEINRLKSELEKTRKEVLAYEARQTETKIISKAEVSNPNPLG